MIIQIDTREQRPLSFTHEWVEGVERVKLDYGDYRCRYKDGTVSKLVYERKSLGDLFGTMGKGYGRFKKEVQRCKDDEGQMIVIIETSVSKVLKGTEHSKMSGVSVLRKLFTIWFRYGIPFVCVGSRREASVYIVEGYISWYRNLVKEEKGK